MHDTTQGERGGERARGALAEALKNTTLEGKTDW